LLGDFDLDWSKKGQPRHGLISYFDDLDHAFEESSLVPLVDFPTWSRKVSGSARESTIDHIYSNDPTSLSSISSVNPCCGDHPALVLDYRMERVPNKISYRRN
jgi:hypothetical protein